MTKQEIIKILKQKQTRGRYNVPFIPCAECDEIADTLLAKIEQEKKEQAKEILKDLYDEAISQQGEVVELTAYYIKNTLAKEYGVEL